jgi:hypothetical protein
MLMEQEITSLRKLVEQEVDYCTSSRILMEQEVGHEFKNGDGTRGESQVQEW